MLEDGKKSYRDQKAFKEEVNVFFKGTNWNRVKRTIDGSYEWMSIKSLWANVLEVIMRYLTFDGHFTTLFSSHFMILNHFRNDRWISFPFYLFYFLSHGIISHIKDPYSQVLHEGLILLIMEHVKALAIQTKPFESNHKFQFGHNVCQHFLIFPLTLRLRLLMMILSLILEIVNTLGRKSLFVCGLMGLKLKIKTLSICL